MAEKPIVSVTRLWPFHGFLCESLFRETAITRMPMFANAHISSLGYLCGKNFFPTPLLQESHFGVGWVLGGIFCSHFVVVVVFFFHLINKKNKINY